MVRYIFSIDHHRPSVARTEHYKMKVSLPRFRVVFSNHSCKYLKPAFLNGSKMRLFSVILAMAGSASAQDSIVNQVMKVNHLFRGLEILNNFSFLGAN